MKEKIQELIFHHKNSKNEVSTLLEELNQIEESKIRYEVEYEMRQLMIQDLEELL
jgi:hypothetical protein